MKSPNWKPIRSEGGTSPSAKGLVRTDGKTSNVYHTHPSSPTTIGPLVWEICLGLRKPIITGEAGKSKVFGLRSASRSLLNPSSVRIYPRHSTLRYISGATYCAIYLDPRVAPASSAIPSSGPGVLINTRSLNRTYMQPYLSPGLNTQVYPANWRLPVVSEGNLAINTCQVRKVFLRGV